MGRSEVPDRGSACSVAVIEVGRDTNMDRWDLAGIRQFQVISGVSEMDRSQDHFHARTSAFTSELAAVQAAVSDVIAEWYLLTEPGDPPSQERLQHLSQCQADVCLLAVPEGAPAGRRPSTGTLLTFGSSIVKSGSAFTGAALRSAVVEFAGRCEGSIWRLLATGDPEIHVDESGVVGARSDSSGVERRAAELANPGGLLPSLSSLDGSTGTVLVTSYYPTWPIHWETALEIAQRLLDEGRRVVVLRCDGHDLRCDANLDARPGICRECRARQRRGLNEVRGSVNEAWVNPLGVEELREVRSQYEHLKNLSEWTAWSYDGFDVGRAVHSSMASEWALSDHRPDLSDARTRRMFEVLAESAIAVFRSTSDVLRRESIDEAFVFNGRLASVRAVIRACEAEGVPFKTHERGPTLDRFGLWSNAMPHDIAETQRQMWELRARIGKQRAARLARQFFTERRAGRVRNWRSFTTGQRRGNVGPRGEGRPRIAVFTSTQTEFVSLGEQWEMVFLESQDVALRTLIARCRLLRPDALIQIRMHPNQRGNAREVGEILALEAPDVDVIPPDSEVDSYTLLDQAEMVVSFGSTIGIEAAYWGRTSLLLGPALYKGLGATYEPSSLSELDELLADVPEPLPTTGAEAYGAYYVLGGHPMLMASEDELGHPVFAGRDLASRRARIRRTLTALRAGGRSGK